MTLSLRPHASHGVSAFECVQREAGNDIGLQSADKQITIAFVASFHALFARGPRRAARPRRASRGRGGTLPSHKILDDVTPVLQLDLAPAVTADLDLDEANLTLQNRTYMYVGFIRTYLDMYK